MTIIIAIIIEGTKLHKKRAIIKIANDVEQHKMKMIDYIKDQIFAKNALVSSNMKHINKEFADLIFQSYMIYIGKMTHSIVKTVQYYELKEHDEMVFYISGVTNERNKQTIRKLIKHEINIMLTSDVSYNALLDIDSEDFDMYINHAVNYIENELEFQCICGTLARDIMLDKY